MNILYIDTSSNREITVAIESNGKKDEVTKVLESHRDQVVLPLILELLNKHQLVFGDLEAIEVNPGPGSFTGLRVGVAIANALSYSLKIPVNGTRNPVEPRYA